MPSLSNLHPSSVVPLLVFLTAVSSENLPAKYMQAATSFQGWKMSIAFDVDILITGYSTFKIQTIHSLLETRESWLWNHLSLAVVVQKIVLFLGVRRVRRVDESVPPEK